MDDSHPFGSMSIRHPIPEIRLFQTLTLELQSEGHGCGQKAMSYSCPSFLSIRFLFISHQSDQQFLIEIQLFQNDHETSQVKVMSEVKGQGHILYPVYNQCISSLFHINQTHYSWDKAKVVFDLEKTHLRFLKKITVSNRTSTFKLNNVHD